MAVTGNSYAQAQVYEAEFEFEMTLSVTDGKLIPLERGIVDKLVFTEKDLLEGLKRQNKRNKPELVVRREANAPVNQGLLKTVVTTLVRGEPGEGAQVKFTKAEPTPDGILRASFGQDRKQITLAESEAVTFEAGDLELDGITFKATLTANTKNTQKLSKGVWVLGSQVSDFVGGVQIKVKDVNGQTQEINSPVTGRFKVGTEKLLK